MAKWHKLFFSKVLALLLSFLLFNGNFQLYSDRSAGNLGNHNQVVGIFNDALSMYGSGKYQPAAVKLVAILNEAEDVEPALQAKIFLLLGASYEKSGETEKAGQCFQKLKKIVDNGFITSVPDIPGIEPESLNEYREVFEEESLIKLKKPLEVSEMLRKNVVHAPKKSKEQKEKEKTKKKFPWLIAVGAVVIIGTAAVLLLTSKKQTDTVRIPKIEWIRIPAGEFLMGDNFNEGEPDELPVHKVYLDEYYISKYEIKRDQYKTLCEATGRRFPFGQGDLFYPADFLSWIDAKAFCDWLSEVTGENIRLPTEAQWEKAARGTDQRRYPWGNDEKESDTDDVSPYGVNDMGGRVLEWCRDWYAPAYYAISPEKNPDGPASGTFRVVRGGNHNSDAEGLRSAKRHSVEPLDNTQAIGFRIVKEK